MTEHFPVTEKDREEAARVLRETCYDDVCPSGPCECIDDIAQAIATARASERQRADEAERKLADAVANAARDMRERCARVVEDEKLPASENPYDIAYNRACDDNAALLRALPDVKKE